MTFYGVDTKGNTEGAHTVYIPIDYTPPVTTFSQAANTVVSLPATDNASGVSATYYSIDGGPTQTGNGPINPWPAGNHTIVFWSVDVAGNTEAQQSASFTDVYVTYPSYPGPPYLISQTSSGATIGWNASNDPAGIASYTVIRVTGHSGRGGGVILTPIGSSSTNQITLPSSDGGELVIKATDNAGLSTLGSPATISF